MFFLYVFGFSGRAVVSAGLGVSLVRRATKQRGPVTRPCSISLLVALIALSTRARLASCALYCKPPVRFWGADGGALPVASGGVVVKDWKPADRRTGASDEFLRRRRHHARLAAPLGALVDHRHDCRAADPAGMAADPPGRSGDSGGFGGGGRVNALALRAGWIRPPSWPAARPDLDATCRLSRPAPARRYRPCAAPDRDLDIPGQHPDFACLRLHRYSALVAGRARGDDGIPVHLPRRAAIISMAAAIASSMLMREVSSVTASSAGFSGAAARALSRASRVRKSARTSS